MQQVAVTDYVSGSIDIYTIPDDVDVQEWLEDNGLVNEDCFFVTNHPIVPITVHVPL